MDTVLVRDVRQSKIENTEHHDEGGHGAVGYQNSKHQQVSTVGLRIYLEGQTLFMFVKNCDTGMAEEFPPLAYL